METMPIHSRDILHERADMFIPEHEFDCMLLYQHRIEAFLTEEPDQHWYRNTLGARDF